MQLAAGAPPGYAFVCYVLAYDVVRFGLEFLRGDPDRPMLAGFSEAQWTATLCSFAIGAAGLAGWLSLANWQLPLAAGPLLALTAVAVTRRCRTVRRDRLLHPEHVRELAGALRWAGLALWNQRTAVPVASTSLIFLSVGHVTTPGDEIRHYTVSGKPGTLVTTTSARVLAEIVARLDQLPAVPEVTAGDGVHHLLASVGPTMRASVAPVGHSSMVPR
jgi:hypothetical protein